MFLMFPLEKKQQQQQQHKVWTWIFQLHLQVNNIKCGIHLWSVQFRGPFWRNTWIYLLVKCLILNLSMDQPDSMPCH